MEDEYKLLIIGSEDIVSGFKAIGVDVLGVDSPSDCLNKIKLAMESEEYGIIFITEDWAGSINDYLVSLPPKALPVIVAIPSQLGSTGVGLANLKRITEQAVGSDILANE